MTGPLSPTSLIINVATLPARGRRERFEPDAGQRRALAAAHGLASADRLVAELTIKRWQRDGVRVAGTVTADIVQTCVVSLEPVPARIEAPVDAVFVPEGSRLARPRSEGAAHDIIVDPDGPDTPEVFAPPDLDIGAVAEEFFALALDPYPRAPGAAPVGNPARDAGDDAPESPFAALAALRNRS